MSAPALGIRFSGAEPGERNVEGVTKALELWTAGKMRIPVAATFPLGQAAEALALSESGGAGGKLILTVGELS
ncbi:MAG: zinc-binding dehydrogenase [Microthrixaceae bacterium]